MHDDGKGLSMAVMEHLWRGRRVRVAGVVEQVAVDSLADMAAVYQRYWDLVYRRCRATLQDDEAATDAAQDVFLLALDNFDVLRDDIVRGLLDIARTISYERAHRPTREICLPDPPRPSNGSDDPAEIAERHGMLNNVWSGLSDVERRYLADKLAGFSFEEIAERNGRKLGTVSSNLFRAREHARRMRGLPAVLCAAGWRRVTDLGRRARNAAHATSTAAAAQPVPGLTVSLALVGLLAGTTPAAVGATAHGGRGSASGPTAVVPPAQASAGAAPVMALAGASGPGAPAQYAASGSGSRQPGSAAPLLALPGPASSETPEDTTFYTATPSPHYDEDHTILALGYGNSCKCNVLLRSTDGGATWTARTGAPDGNQLVLPPDYPNDSGIFIGHSYGGPGTSVWYANGFDEPFLALRVPAGSIALPAGYDAGDKRVVVSAPGGVWSYDVASTLMQPLVVEPRDGVVAALATPLGSLQTGVLAMTSSEGVAPGNANRQVSTDPNTTTLWTCPPRGACHAAATVPVGPGASLAIAPDFAARPVLLAYQSDGPAVVSQDGGQSFAAMALPAGASGVYSAALAGTGQTTSRWLVVSLGHAAALEFSPSLDGAWHQVDYGLGQIVSPAGRVVPIGGHRALYLSGTNGFVCTNDDGAHWSSRCPAA